MLKTIELLNQEIIRMKEVMIEMYHIIATNPDDKKEIFIKKIKELEDQEPILIESINENVENKSKTNAKRKVNFTKEEK